MDDDDLDLLNEIREAAHEIRRLRHDNELLAAKVQTMELLAQFLHAELPRQSQGMVPDIVWALERRAQRIEDAPLLAAKERSSQGGEPEPARSGPQRESAAADHGGRPDRRAGMVWHGRTDTPQRRADDVRQDKPQEGGS